MSTQASSAASRWWERCAQAARLELPARLIEVPAWLLAEGETRRLTVGPAVRGVEVGSGFTGSVLLDALMPVIPLDGAVVSAVMDHALEGPLWVDVGPQRVCLEGCVFAWSGGAARWVEVVQKAAAGGMGPIDPRGVAACVDAVWPDARVAGTALEVSPVPEPSLVLQAVVSESWGGFGAGWQAAAAAAGVSAEQAELAAAWMGRFAAGGPCVTEVCVGMGSGGVVELRWWNVSVADAEAFLKRFGMDGDGASRLERLIALSQRQDIARAVLRLGGKSPQARLVLDMGLMGY